MLLVGSVILLCYNVHANMWRTCAMITANSIMLCSTNRADTETHLQDFHSVICKYYKWNTLYNRHRVIAVLA